MVKTSYISLQGKRPSNEDEHLIYINMNYETSEEQNPINIYAVFDGHGGKLVSKFAKEHLYKFFIKKDNELFIDTDYTTKHIKKVFSQFNDLIERHHPRAVYTSGSTCCIIVTRKDPKGTLLWAINIGDSRAVLLNKKDEAIQLTHDHQPNTPDERKRIEAIPGGKEAIKNDGGVWRVKYLAVSRAFGDKDSHPFVSSLPQVYRYRLNPKDKLLCVACDGVWDVFTCKSAINFLKNKISNKNPAKELGEEALNKGTTDNVTAIVVEL